MENEQFNPIKFLQNAGIQEWILGGEENFKGFLSWFTNNVSADNVLTDKEIIEFNELEAEGKALDAQEVEKALQSIDKTYPKIWQNTDKDVQNLQHELEEAEFVKQHYEQQSLRLKSIHSQLIEEIADISKKVNHLNVKESKLIEKQEKTIDDLQKIKVENQKSIIKLMECYTKPQEYPLFIHQMPLEQYFKKCQTFLSCAESYMEKNFKIESPIDSNENSDDSSEYSEVLRELEEVRNRIYRGRYALCTQKSIAYAQKKLTETLRTENWVPMNATEMRNVVLEMEIRNEQVLELKKDALMNKIEDQLSKITDQDTEMVIYESNQIKIERAKKRYDLLKKFAEVVSGGVMNTEIIWILLQLDLSRVDKRNHFHNLMENYKTETQTSKKRTEMLQSIKASNREGEAGLVFLQLLQRILSNRQSQISSVSPNTLTGAHFVTLLGDIDRCKLNVNNCLGTMLNMERNEHFESCQKKLNQFEKLLKSYVYDGPVNKPEYWNKKLFIKNIQIQNKYKLLSDKMQHHKIELKEHMSKFARDDDWRQLQLLWIWFLADPKKVKKAIKSITAKALLASQVKAKSKAISGIIRKH